VKHLFKKEKPKLLRLDIQYFAGSSDKSEPETNEGEVKSYVVMDSKDSEKGRLHFEGIELKASEEEKGVIEGYASTFGNIDRHGDIIEKGAFSSTRKRIPIFGMHNPHLGIGVGTVTEDEKGLKIRIKLAIDNTESDILRERAREYYGMVKEGIIERMSIGFATLDQEFTKKKVNGRDRHIRIIKKVDLMETSLVPIPANDLARVQAVKSFDDMTTDQQAIVTKMVNEKTEDLQEQLKTLKAEKDKLEKEKLKLEKEFTELKEKKEAEQSLSRIIDFRL
jgi:uncharacterized protein